MLRLIGHGPRYLYVRRITRVNVRPGIKLLNEIVGYGDPIADGDRFEAVMKFYQNKGDPILFDWCNEKPIPEIKKIDGKEVIGWMHVETKKTNTIYHHNGCLTRQSDLIVGIYYSIIGMKEMGYRFVKIAPHFLSDSMVGVAGIKKGSIVKVEIFLLKVAKSA